MSSPWFVFLVFSVSRWGCDDFLPNVSWWATLSGVTDWLQPTCRRRAELQGTERPEAARVASRRKPAGEMEPLPVSPGGSRDSNDCNASWVRSVALSKSTTQRQVHWSEFSQTNTETKISCLRFSPSPTAGSVQITERKRGSTWFWWLFDLSSVDLTGLM